MTKVRVGEFLLMRSAKKPDKIIIHKTANYKSIVTNANFVPCKKTLIVNTIQFLDDFLVGDFKEVAGQDLSDVVGSVMVFRDYLTSHLIENFSD